MTTAPLCFMEPRMFALWMNSSGPKDDCQAGPCTDCLPAYQLRMKKQGRCAHPETNFGVRDDGGIFGWWPT